jgi:hypothetical protein
MADSINIEIKGIDQISKTLENIPGGTRLALQSAILWTLRRGKAAARRLAKERYNFPPAWMAAQIGQPRLSGITSGLLRISGSRLPLGMVPGLVDTGVTGVRVPEMRGRPELELLHAFARTGRVLERTSPSRLPLRSLVGASAAAMVGVGVWPQLQKSLQQDLNTELQRLVRLILDGSIVPRESR